MEIPMGWLCKNFNVDDKQLPLLRPTNPNDPKQVLVRPMEDALGALDLARGNYFKAIQHTAAQQGADAWVLPDDTFNWVARTKYGTDGSRLTDLFGRPGAEFDPDWNPQGRPQVYIRAGKFDTFIFQNNIEALAPNQLIETLTAKQLLAEQREGRKAMQALAFEKWANKNLFKPPGYEGKEIKWVPPELQAKAAQFISDLDKYAAANPAIVERARREAFVQEVERASEAVMVWGKANPNDPLTQQVMADIVEKSKRPGGFNNEENLRGMADVLLKAYHQLKETGKLSEPADNPPRRRNSMLGGEEPVW
jgi:hypothetical protein